jgi:heat shock protein HtpX
MAVNGLRAAVVLGLLSGGVLLLGGLLAGPAGVASALAVVFVAGGCAYSLAGRRIALRAMRAREVSAAEAPWLHTIVAELAARRGVPMPRVYLSPTSAPNAFAAGRNPAHAAVCVTEGLVETLDERELRGVLGHEISHIGNADSPLASVAVGLAAALMVVVDPAQLGVVLGYGAEDDDGPGVLQLLLLAVVGSVAAGLTWAATSRSGEYQADAAGAEITGDPLALATALRKIEIGAASLPLAPTAHLVSASALMIANPFACGVLGRLSCAHPPVAERVARLEERVGPLTPESTVESPVWGGPSGPALAAQDRSPSAR